ncbi:MAG: toll/interleukin-1 receptor domain-containing protein [Rhizobiaceae bacterium]
MTHDPLDELRTRIASGRLGETLDILVKALPRRGPGVGALADFRNRLLILRATVSEVGQRHIEGRAAPTDATELRRVTAATLETLDEIGGLLATAGATGEKFLAALPAPTSEAPATSDAPRPVPAPTPPLVATAVSAVAITAASPAVATAPTALPQSLAASAPASETDADARTEPDEEIFFSYKREDRETVRILVDILKGRGWSVFWDPQILPGEPNWDMLLERKLNAARCVVIAWSKLAAKSSFVRTEAHHGRNRGILVAVTLDGTIPATFALVQTVNLKNWNGASDDPKIETVLRGIEKLLA